MDGIFVDGLDLVGNYRILNVSLSVISTWSSDFDDSDFEAFDEPLPYYEVDDDRNKIESDSDPLADSREEEEENKEIEKVDNNEIEKVDNNEIEKEKEESMEIKQKAYFDINSVMNKLELKARIKELNDKNQSLRLVGNFKLCQLVELPSGTVAIIVEISSAFESGECEVLRASGTKSFVKSSDLRAISGDGSVQDKNGSRLFRGDSVAIDGFDEIGSIVHTSRGVAFVELPYEFEEKYFVRRSCDLTLVEYYSINVKSDGFKAFTVMQI